MLIEKITRQSYSPCPDFLTIQLEIIQFQISLILQKKPNLFQLYLYNTSINQTSKIFLFCINLAHFSKLLRSSSYKYFTISAPHYIIQIQTKCINNMEINLRCLCIQKQL